jgi:DNA adenine methylase
VVQISVELVSRLSPYEEKRVLKTPISYYGGKQQLAKTIVGLIPPHRLYCEPFLGGAAIFFAKEPATVEIINDTNGELVNFYKVLKTNFGALEREITQTLHSRRLHEQAWVIYQNPDMFNPVKRAWAIWVLANSSYGCKLNGTFGYDRKGCNSKKLDNKRENFTTAYEKRLRRAQIESCDAVRIIKSRDVPDGFFYLDPPYVGADQGHYDGYTQEDFDNLLSLLESIKGKFLLSSYKNKALDVFTKRNGWSTIELRMECSMTNRYDNPKTKTEVLTANYPINLEKPGNKGSGEKGRE